MTERKINVLIVDDSALIRRIIQNILEQDPDINVIGVAKNGLDALEKAKKLNPDVITLDLEMPVMDGITCLENLQKQGDYAVIMISGLTHAGADATIKALELGAFDFIYKMNNLFDSSISDRRDEIIDKVKLASRTLIKEKTINKPKSKVSAVKSSGRKKTELKYVIALGISTGGPKALSNILPLFPADLPAAIVIVQHMPPGFTKSLAERLNEQSQLAIKEAEDDDILEAGHAYIAPGNFHLTFYDEGENHRIKLTQTPPVGSFRPSVDVMMTSLAETKANSIIGIIMTGMGSDGSKGLTELKNKKNAYVIAQDESTSIVFGMPKAAIQCGVVDDTVPLQEIPACIMKFMGVYH